MEPVRETKGTMETLLRRFAALQDAPPMTPEEWEDRLHTEVWRSDWAEVLRLLEAAPGPVPRKAANECAVLAVQKAPVGVVEQVLERLPEGVYTECDAYLVDWSPTGEERRGLKWDVCVQGTLVMHAVAGNRPDVLELLLARGYDVNCASAASAAALLQDHSENISGYGDDFIPFHPCTARPENRVTLRNWDTRPDETVPMEWEGATPLALAVLMGRADCARILIGHGAWLEEAPSVSAAMYLAWREKDPDYQKAREAVLEQGDHPRHRPVLWAAGETCSPRQLQTILEGWDYTGQELTAAARHMVLALRHQRALWSTYTDGWQDLCRRVCRIARRCPEAVADRQVIGVLADHAFSFDQGSLEPLVSLLEGRTLDLSEMTASLSRLDRPGTRERFTELARRCLLVMDRDAVEPQLPAGALRLLMKHVTFLPSGVDTGVSGLSRAILGTGDLRLIRGALQRGLIPPEESLGELMRCQQALRLPAVCRSVLLTTPRPKREVPPECPPAVHIHHRWFAEPEDGRVPSVLEGEDWARHFWFALRYSFRSHSVPAAGEMWQLHKTFFAACMLGRKDLVERWLRHLPEGGLRNIDSAYGAERNVMLVLSPLCAAALGGQTETVELLLARGAPLREEECGNPSTCTFCWNDDDKALRLPLNPVLAAALGGHWDTVRCLLDRGGRCDWRAPEVREVWTRFRTDTPEEAMGAD